MTFIPFVRITLIGAVAFAAQAQASVLLAQDVCEGAAQSQLPFQLVGASVYGNPADSLASIATYGARGHRSASLYSVNACTRENRFGLVPCQRLPGGHTVVAIGRKSVCIANAETQELERVTTQPPAQSAATTKTAPPPRKKPSRAKDRRRALTEKITGGIEKTGANEFSVSRESVLEAQQNLAALSTHGRFVPAFENGEAIGFKLSRVKSGGIFKEIGLRKGDVITGVNGYDISSPDQALMLYQKLKDGQDFSVDVKRKGSNMTLDYRIR